MVKYLFLIGAPKCGTSSLFNQLVAHPKIDGANPKESYALLPDNHPLATSRRFNGLQPLLENHRFTTTQNDSESIFIEGTTHNFFSDQVAETVADLGDQARAVVLLRQPAKRVLSSFQYTKQNLARVKKSFSFAEYVECLLSGDRDRIMAAVPDQRSGPILCSDLHYSEYVHHVQRWHDAIGPEKLKVLISEEYFNESSVVVSEIFKWLDIENFELSAAQLGRRNPTRRIASGPLHRIAMKINQSLPRLGILRPVKSIYFQLQSILDWDASEDVSGPMKKLNEHFRPRIEKLSELLGRDLSVWDP